MGVIFLDVFSWWITSTSSLILFSVIFLLIMPFFARFYTQNICQSFILTYMLSPIVPSRILFLRTRWRWKRKHNASFKGLAMRTCSYLVRCFLPMWGRNELIPLLSWVELILRKWGRFLVRAEASWFFWHAWLLFLDIMVKISKSNMFYRLANSQVIRVAMNSGTYVPTP